MDFDRYQLHVRRAIVKSQVTTPKTGRDRMIVLAPPLAEILFDLLALRRRQVMEKGWKDVPPWVFPSETGGPLDQDNFERS